MFKKISAAVLAFCMLFCAVNISAAPRIPVYKSGNVLYFFDKSTGTITAFAGDPKDVTIPVTLGGYAVNAIGDGAFSSSPTLTTLTIPDGIVRIGESAFEGCTLLKSVSIGRTVSYVGARAFAGCSALEKVSFAGQPAEIEPTAFSGTPWYTSSGEKFVILGQTTLLKYNGSEKHVTVPAGITNISAGAFAYNTNVESVTLPAGLREIGENAFVHCYSLSAIDIPTTVSYIGTGAFDDTAWLYNFKEPFVTVNGILISYKGGEKHVTLPGGITGIGAGAFMENDTVCSLRIPNSVLYIDSMAFSGCERLSLVNIPDSVEWIDEYAFSGCERLVITGNKYQYPYYYAVSHGISYSEEVYVKVNSQEVFFDNMPPVIYYDRTYIPLRPVMELIGWNVSYDKENEAVKAAISDKVVEIFPDGRIYTNGVLNPTIAPPLVINDTTLVSARVLAEAVGAAVQWDDLTHTANFLY